MKIRAFALAAAAFAANAFSQSPAPSAVAPATVTPVAEPVLAKHGCIKPELPDASKKISEARMKAFVAGIEVYKECVTSFAQGQQKTADQQQKVAQAAIAAANSAIKEYNDYVEEAKKATAPKDETQQNRANGNVTKPSEPKPGGKTPY